MKLNNLFYSLVFISGALFAQEDKSETILLQTLEKNELKLNMFELLVMPAIGITYERYINPTSSFGAYGFFNFGIDEGYRYEKFEFAPFYRIYFQRRDKLDNKGLYTEVFTSVALVKLIFLIMILTLEITAPYINKK